MTSIRKYICTKKKLFLLVTLILILIIGLFLLKDTKDGYNYDDAKLTNPYKITKAYNNLIYKDDLNSKYNTYSFLPQEGVINQEKEIMIRGFVGEKIFLIPYFTILDNLGPAIKIIQILFVLIIGISLLCMLKILNKNVSLILVTIFLPLITIMLNILFPQLALLCISVVLTLLVLQSINKYQNKLFINVIIGLLSGLLISINYIYSLFVFAYMVILLTHNRKKFFLRNIICITIPIVIVLSPTLIVNYQFLGKPIETTYTAYISPYYLDNPALINQSLILNRNLVYELANNYLYNNNFVTNQINNIHLLLILGGIMFPGIYFFLIVLFDKRSYINKNYTALITIIAIMAFVILGLGNYFGINDLDNYRPSLIRYLILPLFFINLLGFIKIRESLSNKKYIITICLYFILFILVIFSARYPFNYYVDNGSITQIEVWNQMKQDILNKTDEDTIIFTERSDYGHINIERKTFNMDFPPDEIKINETRRVLNEVLQDKRKACILRKNSRNNSIENFVNYNGKNITISEIPSSSKSYALICINSDNEK